MPGATGASRSGASVEAEERILQLCQEIPEGINDKILQNDMPELNAEQRVMAINRLLAGGRIDLFNQNGVMIYKLKATKAKPPLKSGGCSNNEEQVVYSIIGDAGNKGIWIRDIRYKSNLMLTQLNKILKSLEGKKMIKAVKSVSASKKKVYMLFNLEPDRSLTGGAWYSTQQDFEAEFVEVLSQQCFRFLSQRLAESKKCRVGPLAARNIANASSDEVGKFISELEISKVSLSRDDIETILETLTYDGRVEKIVVADASSCLDRRRSATDTNTGAKQCKSNEEKRGKSKKQQQQQQKGRKGRTDADEEGEESSGDDWSKPAGSSGSGRSREEEGQKRLYRAVDSLVPMPGFVKVPCGMCQVMSDCSTFGATISPSKCVYMKEW